MLKKLGPYLQNYGSYVRFTVFSLFFRFLPVYRFNCYSFLYLISQGEMAMKNNPDIIQKIIFTQLYDDNSHIITLIRPFFAENNRFLPVFIFYAFFFWFLLRMTRKSVRKYIICVIFVPGTQTTAILSTIKEIILTANI